MTKDTKARLEYGSRFKKAIVWLGSENERQRLLILSGTYLFGLLLAYIIRSEGAYVPLATVFGGFTMLIMNILFTVGTLTTDYPSLVKLGTSRRTALMAAISETLGMPLVLSVVLVLLAYIEKLLCAGGDRPLFLPTELLMTMLVVLNLLCHTFGLVSAVLINRFGHNGLVAAWFMFIFGFSVLPIFFTRLSEKCAWFAECLKTVAENPAAAAVLISAVCIIISAFMQRTLYKAAF